MTLEEMERRRQLLKDQYQPMFSMPSFSMPNLMNLFGGQTGPTPEELEAERIRLEKLNPVPVTRTAGAYDPDAPPGAFGIPGFMDLYGRDPAKMAEQENFQNNLQKAIGTVYNLEGDNAGTLVNPSPTEPGFMERLNNLSGDEMLEGIRGVQGLLDAVSPPQQELVPAKIYSASPGLSLSVNPYEELYKRQGILRG